MLLVPDQIAVLTLQLSIFQLLKLSHLDYWQYFSILLLTD